MTKDHAWKRSELRRDIRTYVPGNPRSNRTNLSVGGLWRIVEALGGDTSPAHRRYADDTKNEPEIREWIADELDFEYDPTGRVRAFNNSELAAIRDALEQDIVESNSQSPENE